MASKPCITALDARAQALRSAVGGGSRLATCTSAQPQRVLPHQVKAAAAPKGNQAGWDGGAGEEAPFYGEFEDFEEYDAFGERKGLTSKDGGARARMSAAQQQRAAQDAARAELLASSGLFSSGIVRQAYADQQAAQQDELAKLKQEAALDVLAQEVAQQGFDLESDWAALESTKMTTTGAARAREEAAKLSALQQQQEGLQRQGSPEPRTDVLMRPPTTPKIEAMRREEKEMRKRRRLFGDLSGSGSSYDSGSNSDDDYGVPRMSAVQAPRPTGLPGIDQKQLRSQEAAHLLQNMEQMVELLGNQGVKKIVAARSNTAPPNFNSLPMRKITTDDLTLYDYNDDDLDGSRTSRRRSGVRDLDDQLADGVIKQVSQALNATAAPPALKQRPAKPGVTKRSSKTIAKPSTPQSRVTTSMPVSDLGLDDDDLDLGWLLSEDLSVQPSKAVEAQRPKTAQKTSTRPGAVAGSTAGSTAGVSSGSITDVLSDMDDEFEQLYKQQVALQRAAKAAASTAPSHLAAKPQLATPSRPASLKSKPSTAKPQAAAASSSTAASTAAASTPATPSQLSGDTEEEDLEAEFERLYSQAVAKVQTTPNASLASKPAVTSTKAVDSIAVSLPSPAPLPSLAKPARPGTQQPAATTTERSSKLTAGSVAAQQQGQKKPASASNAPAALQAVHAVQSTSGDDDEDEDSEFERLYAQAQAAAARAKTAAATQARPVCLSPTKPDNATEMCGSTPVKPAARSAGASLQPAPARPAKGAATAPAATPPLKPAPAKGAVAPPKPAPAKSKAATKATSTPTPGDDEEEEFERLYAQAQAALHSKQLAPELHSTPVKPDSERGQAANMPVPAAAAAPERQIGAADKPQAVSAAARQSGAAGAVGTRPPSLEQLGSGWQLQIRKPARPGSSKQPPKPTNQAASEETVKPPSSTSASRIKTAVVKEDRARGPDATSQLGRRGNRLQPSDSLENSPTDSSAASASANNADPGTAPVSQAPQMAAPQQRTTVRRSGPPKPFPTTPLASPPKPSLQSPAKPAPTQSVVHLKASGAPPSPPPAPSPPRSKANSKPNSLRSLPVSAPPPRPAAPPPTVTAEENTFQKPGAAAFAASRVGQRDYKNRLSGSDRGWREPLSLFDDDEDDAFKLLLQENATSDGNGKSWFEGLDDIADVNGSQESRQNSASGSSNTEAAVLTSAAHRPRILAGRVYTPAGLISSTTGDPSPQDPQAWVEDEDQADYYQRLQQSGFPYTQHGSLNRTSQKTRRPDQQAWVGDEEAAEDHDLSEEGTTRGSKEGTTRGSVSDVLVGRPADLQQLMSEGPLLLGYVMDLLFVNNKTLLSDNEAELAMYDRMLFSRRAFNTLGAHLLSRYLDPATSTAESLDIANLLRVAIFVPVLAGTGRSGWLYKRLDAFDVQQLELLLERLLIEQPPKEESCSSHVGFDEAMEVLVTWKPVPPSLYLPGMDGDSYLHRLASVLPTSKQTAVHTVDGELMATRSDAWGPETMAVVVEQLRQHVGEDVTGEVVAVAPEGWGAWVKFMVQLPTGTTAAGQQGPDMHVEALGYLSIARCPEHMCQDGKVKLQLGDMVSARVVCELPPFGEKQQVYIREPNQQDLAHAAPRHFRKWPVTHKHSVWGLIQGVKEALRKLQSDTKIDTSDGLETVSIQTAFSLPVVALLDAGTPAIRRTN